PDCKWGELTAEQRARQMELKRRYEEAHQLLRLILRGGPKNLLQRFQDADKRFRVWLEFQQLNWSLSAQPERNRSRVLQDGARLLETLAVVDAIGLHDVVIVPDMYSLLQRPDPADYRAVIGRGSFVFVLLPAVLAELGRLSLGHSNPDVRERARRVVANVKAWRRQGSLHGGVIVDEAQDLTPVGLSVCIELCKDPAGLYLTADASQSIYSRGFSWQRVHDDLRVRGRTTVLKRNYRMTRQIGAAAVQLLREHGGGDEEVLENNAVHWGPKPVLLGYESVDEEARAIAEFLRRSARELSMPVHHGAVLVRTNELGKQLADALSAAGVPAQHLRSAEVTLDMDRVRVMTVHAAKGLEFPFVAVARVNSGLFPSLPWKLPDEEREERLAHERRLLFVALTRAMRRLMLTYDRSAPSPFVAELDKSLWSPGLNPYVSP